MTVGTRREAPPTFGGATFLRTKEYSMKPGSHLVRPLVLCLAGAVFGALVLGGCASEQADPTEDGEFAVEDGPGENVDESTSALGGCGQCSNCVDYARCRQRRLPHNLTSFSDKARTINSQTGHAGCVAIIRTGSYYGHVAYVNSMAGGRVHIDEGNWPSGRCGQRSGTKAGLNIAGYFCP